MAGRLTIQRFPKGLLDWLGMKGSGDVPADLSPLVQSSIEIGPLYLLDRIAQAVTGSPNINANGTFAAVAANLTVPPGEQWMLTNYTIARTANFGAGTGGTFQGAYFRAAVTQYFALPGPVVCPVAGSFAWTYQFKPYELVLSPGDLLAGYVTSGVFGIPAGVNMFAEYYRMTI